MRRKDFYPEGDLTRISMLMDGWFLNRLNRIAEERDMDRTDLMCLIVGDWLLQQGYIRSLNDVPKPVKPGPKSGDTDY